MGEKWKIYLMTNEDYPVYICSKSSQDAFERYKKMMYASDEEYAEAAEDGYCRAKEDLVPLTEEEIDNGNLYFDEGFDFENDIDFFKSFSFRAWLGAYENNIVTGEDTDEEWNRLIAYLEERNEIEITPF